MPTRDSDKGSATLTSVHAETSQIDRFKELARELGCDEDEAAFEVALKKVAEAPTPPKHEPKKRGTSA